MAEPNKQTVEEDKKAANQRTGTVSRNSLQESEQQRVANQESADNISDEEKQQQEDQRKQQEAEAKAQAERDERRKKLVEEIAASDEGFVVGSEANADAISEAMADGFLYNSNTQKGIEVEERYYLTKEGWDTRAK